MSRSRRLVQAVLLDAIGAAIILGVLVALTSLGTRYRSIPMVVLVMLLWAPTAVHMSMVWLRLIKVRQDVSGEFRKMQQAPPAAGVAEGSVAVVYPIIAGTHFDWDAFGRSLELNVANNGGHALRHVVLADLPDASTPDADDDGNHHFRAAHMQAELAAKGANVDVLWRPRAWSATEQSYIGRERKRGKLEDFVALSRGDASAFLTSRDMRKVQVVVTLDEGSILPKEGAIRLAKLLLSAENKVAVEKGRVTRGYGVVQPIRTAPENAANSFASAAQAYGSGTAGSGSLAARPSWSMRRYGEGPFTGQGAFLVDVYTRVLSDSVPPELVLSHDKLEGYLLRCAQVADCAIIDEGPAGRMATRRAWERWTRGDVQSLAASRMGAFAALSPLHRWWLARDVVRALEPAALLCLIAVMIPAGSYSSAVVVSAIALYNGSRIISLLRASSWAEAKAYTRQIALFTVNLADDALNKGAAVCRAAIRLLRRRNLLQWTPSSAVGLRSGRPPAVANTVASVAFMLLALAYTDILGVTLAVLWLLQPLVSVVADKPRVK